MILFLTMALQAAAPAAAAPAPAAPWTPRLQSDPATGAKSGKVWAASREGNGQLVVRCDRRTENIVSIQFIPSLPFAAATPRPVSIQVDGGSPLGTNWEFPGKGTYVADDQVVTTLASAIAHAKEIKLRVIDPMNNAVDATFAGPPSDTPIKQVLETCGYVLGQVPTRTPAAAPAASK
ncbi:MAG: hypothetical protein P0Y59_14100 [Candidatus Sphingomonas phytovorans]|nr:hypothetical protein [Sphingomonas sp.]WEJ98083.1 MAG: hypothetical protein P0Y59_14100 [Sphingomonas sp.]